MNGSASLLVTTQNTLSALLPEIVLVVAATAMMTFGAFVRAPRGVWASLSAIALVFALMTLLLGGETPLDPFLAVITTDPFATLGRVLFLVTGLIAVAFAVDQVDNHRAPEFLGCLLLMHAGGMVVACANDLVLMFVGLELVSIPTYLMLYLLRRDSLSEEAATKYFFLSLFASGLFLFGSAYLYGLTGQGNIHGLAYMAHYFPELPQSQFALIAVVFVLAGLGFRVAAVPFHFYAPDVYQGSPTMVTALLAWVPKGVGFLALIRLLAVGLGGDNPVSHQAQVLCWVIAVATLILGNFVALSQENLKRLLAYSSIGHAGYLMIGLVAAISNGVIASSMILGVEGILFYLIAYAFMTLGFFAGLLLLERLGEPAETLRDLTGLAARRPMIALGLSICLASLAGLPLTAGFWGKFQVFASVMTASERDSSSMLANLGFLGMLAAAIGAYYYLRLIVIMCLRDPFTVPEMPADRSLENGSTRRDAALASAMNSAPPWPTAVAFAACAFLTVLLGVLPGPTSRLTRGAALQAINVPSSFAKDQDEQTANSTPAVSPVISSAVTNTKANADAK